MAIAEELYSQGILSYPRTETEVFKEGTDLRELISKQLYSREWGAFADMLLNQGGFEWPKPGKNDDNAHPPIHPTGVFSI
jgi:DNA topoisomerase-3